MDNHEFEDLGKKIQDIVDNAVNSNSYHELSHTISQTVNKAIDSGSEALKNAMNSVFDPGADPEFCNFQKLAQAAGKNEKFVKKDISRMIQKGWFLEGHVDEQGTCLITSNETYQQYLETQKQLELREQESDPKVQLEDNMSPEAQEVLRKGNEFLVKIRKSNDAIPGEEISAKISRMEMIVQKIFERAGEHPEVIPDLKKMMDYYLPMTVKLLDAYEDMDGQPVQGENITASKKEIEETIDTLNIAFEKLLDSIFRDTAWDVSTDISVLHTVLAQEGLTEDDFEKMKQNAEMK